MTTNETAPAAPLRGISHLGPRAAEVQRRFEVPVLIAALLVVPVIIIEETATSAAWQTVAAGVNWAIWAVFLAEFVRVLTIARHRWRYTRSSWLNLFIIVSSFPLLPAALGGTRLLRLTRLTRVLRILRLARLAAVISRGGAAVGTIFRTRGIGYIAMLTLLIALGVGGVFALLEGVPLGDGLWWAIVTLTTVGYGDVFPVTASGRAAASILMLLGIGFVATITASVAAHFVKSDEETHLVAEVSALHTRLDQLEELIRDTFGSRRADDSEPEA